MRLVGKPIKYVTITQAYVPVISMNAWVFPVKKKRIALAWLEFSARANENGRLATSSRLNGRLVIPNITLERERGSDQSYVLPQPQP